MQIRVKELRKLADEAFKRTIKWNPSARNTAKYNRTGGVSIFEQTRWFMVHSDDDQNWFETEPLLLFNQHAWNTDWTALFFQIKFAGEEEAIDVGGVSREWLQLVLQSIVAADKPIDSESLVCLRLGQCRNSITPQLLLEALPSGDMVPILNYEQEVVPEPSAKRGVDEDTGKLGSFNFLGKWLARAYIISGLGFSPAGFHSVIYESILAGRPAVPSPAPNAYKDHDLLRECEWIAGIYGHRRPQELKTYGWQSCDEMIDPETGRYIQEGCYKPLWRSQEMWEYLYTEWGSVAPQGVKPDDLVPFSRAQEYTRLMCKAMWEQNFQAPVAEMVKGFREVIPDGPFWKNLTGIQELKQLLEGDTEVDIERLLKVVSWEGGWSRQQKEVVTSTLHRLAEEGKGLPPMQNPVNKLLRFFTGSFKEPVNGFESLSGVYEVTFMLTRSGEQCAPLVGKTCFNELVIPAGCCQDSTTLDNMIRESIAVEGFQIE